MLFAVGCGAPPHGPYYGDENLLVVGVNPEGEANAVARQLEGRGYHEARRLRGRTFTALGFTPVVGDPQAGRVRVVTERGIALSLDSEAPTALTAGRLVRLLELPYRDSHDVDHDGDDELFVREQPLPSGLACLRVYRVREGGLVEEISSDFALPRPPDSRDPGFADAAFCAAAR